MQTPDITHNFAENQKTKSVDKAWFGERLHHGLDRYCLMANYKKIVTAISGAEFFHGRFASFYSTQIRLVRNTIYLISVFQLKMLSVENFSGQNSCLIQGIK